MKFDPMNPAPPLTRYLRAKSGTPYVEYSGFGKGRSALILG